MLPRRRFLSAPLSPPENALVRSVAAALTEPGPQGQPPLIEPGDERVWDYGVLVTALVVSAGWTPPQGST